MNPDGSLVCLGRKNARVKIRGHGVDLIEIEMALGSLDNVKEAVRNGAPEPRRVRLFNSLYAPTIFPGPTNMTLRQALAETLPDFMISIDVHRSGSFAETTSGKIDRQSLPGPGRAYRDRSRPATSPRTPMEKTIAGIWS